MPSYLPLGPKPQFTSGQFGGGIAPIAGAEVPERVEVLLA